MFNQHGQQHDPYAQQYQQPTQPATRQLTVDDVVTKTAITLGVLTVSAIVSYFLVDSNDALANPADGTRCDRWSVLVLIATFGRKQDNLAIVLAYAAFEGLFVGSISFVFANFVVSGDTSAGALIGQAVLGTLACSSGCWWCARSARSASRRGSPGCCSPA